MYVFVVIKVVVLCSSNNGCTVADSTVFAVDALTGIVVAPSIPIYSWCWRAKKSDWQIVGSEGVTVETVCSKIHRSELSRRLSFAVNSNVHRTEVQVGAR